MTAHTPVKPERIIASAFRIAVEDGSIDDLGVSDEEVERAERIALAAPDLLALVKLMRDWAADGNLFIYLPGMLPEIERAIAKAEGRA